MLFHHRFMRRFLLVALVGFTGCGSTPNPRSCLDGTCTSEEFPFCDVDGTFGDTPETCIAVTCTPDTFAQCRNDIAITCNTLGTDYNLFECPLGCQDGVGCRACEPNQTVCANGAVQACDEVGNVIRSEPCALGCFDTEPRCRDVDPSNGLAVYLDAVEDPPDVDLVGATIFTDTGRITTAAGDIEVPRFTASNGSGPSIRVFVVRDIHINGAHVTSNFDIATGPALAIVASGKITIEGRIRVDGAAGGVKETGCAGGMGVYFEDSDGEPTRVTGSGGGAHATPGGRGGDLGAMLGGARGEASGVDSLIPLRGGCPAGGTAPSLFGSPGGGAIQLVSRVGVSIHGTVDVRGNNGDGQSQCGLEGVCIGGGGAGGGILVEAPTVELQSQSALIAKGGAGAGFGCDDGYPSGDDTVAATQGLPCGTSTGGAGASAGSGAGNGAGFASIPATSPVGTGGGGGGMGRIRINTRTGTYDKDSSAVEAGLVTTDLLKTR